MELRPRRRNRQERARDADGRLALIDWEWAGLYPTGYELAFLWFSLVEVPGGRARVESAVPSHHEPGFLFSAALVHLLHLQLSLRTPNPYIARHKETLRQLLLAATSNSSTGAAELNLRTGVRNRTGRQ